MGPVDVNLPRKTEILVYCPAGRYRIQRKSIEELCEEYTLSPKGTPAAKDLTEQELSIEQVYQAFPQEKGRSVLLNLYPHRKHMTPIYHPGEGKLFEHVRNPGFIANTIEELRGKRSFATADRNDLMIFYDLSES